MSKQVTAIRLHLFSLGHIEHSSHPRKDPFLYGWSKLQNVHLLRNGLRRRPKIGCVFLIKKPETLLDLFLTCHTLPTPPLYFLWASGWSRFLSLVIGSGKDRSHSVVCDQCFVYAAFFLSLQYA